MHIDITIRGPAADSLDRLRRGLDAQHARLETGRYVATSNDALRWLLEQHLRAAGGSPEVAADRLIANTITKGTPAAAPL